jgi:endoglucanase
MNRLPLVAASILMLGLFGCSNEQPLAPADSAIVLPAEIELIDFSDENWTQGVARGWGAAFFLILRPGLSGAMAVGNQVEFSNGEIRAIKSQRVNGDTLIVELEGPPLNGALVGYPNKIKISKPE